MLACDCRYCKEVSQVVVEYQKCRQHVDDAIKLIQDAEFFAVERKQVYEQDGFVLAQSKKQQQVSVVVYAIC